MKRTILHAASAILLIFWGLISGCHTYTATYLHPLYGGSARYKTMPLKSDSVHTALYASASFTNGNSNDLLRDRHSHFAGDLYQTHSFGMFHVYYGANANLGNYRVNPYSLSGYDYYDLDTAAVNRLAGRKFLGNWGLYAGIAFTISSPDIGRYGGEWRILGIHGSFQHEFGDYLHFRRQLNTGEVTKLVDDNQLKTLGISTEWSFKRRNNKNFSLQLQYNFLLGGEYRYQLADNPEARNRRYGYYSTAFQFGKGNFKQFFQFNVGHELLSASLGLNCRLAAFKKNNKPRF